MQSIFFAKNDIGKEVNIFEVKRGLACNCSCLDCGKPLIAYQGDKKAWHFQHQTYTGCNTAEETSLHRLVKIVLSELKFIVLPKVGYVYNKTLYNIAGAEVFNIDKVEVEKVFDDKFKPDIILVDKDSNKVYIEVYVTHKSTGKKIKKYRELNCKALEIHFSEEDFKNVSNYQDLVQVVKDKIISVEFKYEWLSHPQLNQILNLLEDKGVSYSNVSGLSNVYCPQSSNIVLAKDCKSCPFNTYVTTKEVKCRGNLTKEQLMLINPDVVFPPEKVNYAGKCSCCNSDNTVLQNIDDILYRICKDCDEKEQQLCPICGGILRMKRNKDARFGSYDSDFIGCDNCSFTLTYMFGNDFADEVKFTGGLDSIHINPDKYKKDLLKYRHARVKRRS